MFDLEGYGWMLLKGVQMTIAVALVAMLVAMSLGILGALAKRSDLAPLRWLANLYTTVVRGVPELIMLLLIFYGVPTLIQDVAAGMGHEIQIDLNPFIAGVITIGFIYGAFCTEVFRGAFQSVAPGLLEAGRSLGMDSGLAFRRIHLPLAMRMALPGLFNVWLVLVKATALVSLIQLDELMRAAKVAANATHKPFTAYFLASLLFLAITLVSQFAQHRAERWAARGSA